MGGNALKKFGVTTDRLATRDYNQFWASLHSELNLCFHEHVGYGLKFGVTKSLGFKKDHGDLDVLCTSDFLPHDYQKKLKDHFKPQAVYSNGHTFSFEWKNFQVDLVKVPSQNFEVADFFFSYNDLGGLLGVMARRLGLKFGFDGLHYSYRDQYNHTTDFLLTNDPKEVCALLDVSYERWTQGFYDYEELFTFVTSSKYFNPEFYQFENRNAESRERDSKRKTYMEFLEWLKTHDTPHWKPSTEYLDKLHNNLFATYPEAKHALLHFLKEKQFREAFAAKWNGDLAMEVTGLQSGPKLGKFMAHLKTLTTREFKERVVAGSLNPKDEMTRFWNQFKEL